MNQLGIALFGLSAMWLALERRPLFRTWAPVVGLCGQPFWLIETWGMWGMFALSCVYTVIYVRGVIAQFQAMRLCLQQVRKKISAAFSRDAKTQPAVTQFGNQAPTPPLKD